MGLFKSPWRSKVAAVAAFQSPEPPAEPAAPPTPPPPPGRDAATIVEELMKMTDAVEAARVALARTGTIIPKMGFGEHLEAAEDELDACEAKLDVIVRLGRTSAAATRRLGDAEQAGRLSGTPGLQTHITSQDEEQPKPFSLQYQHVLFEGGDDLVLVQRGDEFRVPGPTRHRRHRR